MANQCKLSLFFAIRYFGIVLCRNDLIVVLALNESPDFVISENFGHLEPKICRKSVEFFRSDFVRSADF